MAKIRCARCPSTWKATVLTQRMTEEDARRFVRGLGCPACWVKPALQQPLDRNREERFIRDLLGVANQLDCPRAMVLDALAEMGGRR